MWKHTQAGAGQHAQQNHNAAAAATAALAATLVPPPFQQQAVPHPPASHNLASVNDLVMEGKVGLCNVSPLNFNTCCEVVVSSELQTQRNCCQDLLRQVHGEA